MATRWLFEFVSDSGIDYRIEIQDRDYTGEPVQRSLGSSPTLRMDEALPFRGTSLDMDIECLVEGEYLDLYTSDPTRFAVKLYAAGKLMWTGFVTPEQYAYRSVPTPYDIRVSATDGIGYLKDVQYTYTGRHTISEVLSHCLMATGLEDLRFHFVSEIYCSNQGEPGAEFFINKCTVEMQGEQSVYDALSSLLTSLGYCVMQWSGAWLVIREADISADRSVPVRLHEYNRVQCLYQGTDSLSNFALTTGAMGTEPNYPIGEGTVEVVPARKSIHISYPVLPRTGLVPAVGEAGWVAEGSYLAPGTTDLSIGTGYRAYYMLNNYQNTDWAASRVTTPQVVFFGGYDASFAVRLVIRTALYCPSSNQYPDGQIQALRIRVKDRSVPSGGTEPVKIRYYDVEKQQWSESEVWNNINSIRLAISGTDKSLYMLNDEDFAETAIEGIVLPNLSDNMGLDITFKNDYNFGLPISMSNPALFVGNVDVQAGSLPAGLRLRGALADARQDGEELELAFGDGVSEAYPSLVQSNFIGAGGSIAIGFASSMFPDAGMFIRLRAKDRARRDALPRLRYTANLNVDSALWASELLLADNTELEMRMLVESFTLSLLTDEMSVSLLSVPAGEVTITEDVEVVQGQEAFYGSSGGGGSSAGGTTNHAALTNRDKDDQHPISAITGLVTALAGKADTVHDHAGQIIRPKTFVVPQEEPTDLASGETAFFLSPIGFNAETSGGGGGSNVVWDTSLYEGYAKLHVDTIAKDVAIWGHKHDDLYYTQSQSDELFAKKNEIPSLAGYATEEWVLGKKYITASALDPYAKKDGSNASGNWGINITGNAATADSAKSADDAKKLGGIVAANYYHAGNANKEDVNWTANKLKSKTLIIPDETPLNLAEGETAMFLSPVGFSAEPGGGGSGTDVMWESSTHSRYSKLNVGGVAKDVALWGHKHSVGDIEGFSYVSSIGGYSGQIGVGEGLSISSAKVLGINSVSWDKVTGNPTTLAGYGITDAVTIGTTQTITGEKRFSRNTASVVRVENTDLSAASDYVAVRFYHGGTDVGGIAGIKNGSALYRITPGFSQAYKLLDSSNYANTLDGRYVKKSGDTMSGRLIIDTAFADSLHVDSSNSSRTYINILRNGTQKAAVGYIGDRGAFLYSWVSGQYLGITDSGILKFDSSTVWHSGNDGSDSGLDADLLDGQHGEWYRKNGLKFSRTAGTSTAGGYDANTLIGKGGIMVNMSSYSNWANTPTDMQIGSVFHIEAYNYAAGAAQFAWDTTANSTTAPTKRLWFRAANNVGFAKDWKEIWHSGNSNLTTIDWACKSLQGATFGLGGTEFHLYNSTAKSRRLTFGWNGEIARIYNFNGSSYQDLSLGQTDNASNIGKLYFKASANSWGIGTTAPSERLDVNGNIKANVVKIKSIYAVDGDFSGKLKSNTLLIPTNPPIDLAAGEVAIFLSPIGFSYTN